MNGKMIVRLLEPARWLGVVIGFQQAFAAGATYQERFPVLAVWVVVSMAGLSGIETVFFPSAAARRSGYGLGGRYQIQAGLSNLALAGAALAAYLLHWGPGAMAAVTTALLLFVSMSGINHLLSAMHDGNTGVRNLMRPVGALLLVACVLPMMVYALYPQP